METDVEPILNFIYSFRLKWFWDLRKKNVFSCFADENKTTKKNKVNRM